MPTARSLLGNGVGSCHLTRRIGAESVTRGARQAVAERSAARLCGPKSLLRQGDAESMQDAGYKRKRLSLRTPKRRVARRVLSKWEDDYLEGRFDPWTDDQWSYDRDTTSPISLKAAVAGFIDAKGHLRPATVRTYREVLRLLEEATGEIQLGRVTASKLSSIIREQKNRKEQTIPLNIKARDVLTDACPRDSRPGDFVFRSPSFSKQERSARWFRNNASAAFREARDVAAFGRS